MRPHPLQPIRDAVASGEFERARLLWDECAAGLAEELDGGTLSAGRLEEVRQLVEWSRTVILCERAYLLGQLNSLRVSGEYEAPAAAPTGRLAEASF